MTFQASTRLLTALLVLASILFFVNLGASSIWDANEAFYVETPREMIERGDLVVPYFNYEPRVNKPVLSYWMVGGLYAVLGESVAVQRVGIAVGGLVIVACAFCLACLIWQSRTAGLVAAIGLAVDPRFVMFSRRIFIDVWTSAFMALTLTFFVASERLPARRRLFLTLMYVSVALGVLTKGPVAAGLPALAFASYLAINRELGRTKEMMILPGLLIVLTIVVPWYVALYLRDGWTHITSFFIGENIGRYTQGIGYQPSRGVGFYLPVIFADGFPLSVFLIPAAVLFRRSREARLLWSWVFVIVLFFSFSHDKQDLYILPILPAVAALAAGALIHAPVGLGLVRATSIALGLVLTLAGGVVLYVVGDGEGPYALAGALTVGWLALAAGSTATALALKRRALAAVTAASIGLTAVNWTVVMRVLPDLERLKPVPTLVETLRPRLASGDVLSTYGVALPSMVYYLRRHVNVHYAPEPFIADAVGSTRMFGVLFESDFAGLRDRVSSGTCVVGRVPAFEVKLRHVLARTPPRNLVLITNDCRF